MVAVINASLGKGKDSLPFVGVLDIFGAYLSAVLFARPFLFHLPQPQSGWQRVHVVEACRASSAHLSEWRSDSVSKDG